MIDFGDTHIRVRRREYPGALVTTYDPKKPQIWRVPLRDQVDRFNFRDRAARRLCGSGGFCRRTSHAGWMLTASLTHA